MTFQDKLPNKVHTIRDTLRRVAEVAIFQDPPARRSVEAIKKPIAGMKDKLADWVLSQENEIRESNKRRPN